MKTIHTDVGPAIMLDRNLTQLVRGDGGGNGHIGLCLLLDAAGKPSCFALVWEWGGDWMGFGDGDQYDPAALNGWEPAAIREAADAAEAQCPECAEDMDWFRAWADAAEQTLATVSHVSWTGLDAELRGTDTDPQDVANARGMVIVRDDDAATVGAECWYGIAAADVAAALADYRESGGTVSQHWVPQSV